MQTKKYRRLIYARPSFLEGMARILDIGGTLNEYHFVSEDSQSASAYWESPPLSPETLKWYDDVVPVSAERIMRMADKQAERRAHAERITFARDSRRAYAGMIFAFALSLLMLAIGAYLIIWGNPWLGAAAIGINHAGLVGVFVYVANARRRERERKADAARRPS